MNSLNPNKTARIAGVLYLLLIPLGIFGIIYVPSNLIVLEDINTTINNIIANELLFRFSIVSSILVQLVNIAVVLLLYKLLKPVNKSIARLMVIFILVAVPIAFLNELNYFAIIFLFQISENSQDLISMFLDMHEHGIFIAQIFWGLWLFPMGYLIFKSDFLPKIIGILLIIGGFGYLIDSFVFFLYPNFGITFSEYTFIGEVVFPLWLVIKGVKTPAEDI